MLLTHHQFVSAFDPTIGESIGGALTLASALKDKLGPVLDAGRVRAAAAAGAANTVLIKPNQRGTLTETRAAWDAACEVGYAGIVSARSGETEDVTIVHLAVGWGVGQLKVGSFARSERMAKWNEGLRIEEALGPAARFAGGGVLGRSRG